MMAENQPQQSGIEQLVTKLREILATDKPVERQFLELGEPLFVTVKGALSGNSS